MMLVIKSLQDGGYVVSEANVRPDFASDFKFATQSIDEALAYIKKTMQQNEAVLVPA